MTADETSCALGRAFRELTLTLIGLFELYEADPNLVEGAAEALGRVICAHLGRPAPARRGRGRARLEALLDEIDAAVKAAEQTDQPTEERKP